MHSQKLLTAIEQARGGRTPFLKSPHKVRLACLAETTLGVMLHLSGMVACCLYKFVATCWNSSLRALLQRKGPAGGCVDGAMGAEAALESLSLLCLSLTSVESCYKLQVSTLFLWNGISEEQRAGPNQVSSPLVCRIMSTHG